MNKQLSYYFYVIYRPISDRTHYVYIYIYNKQKAQPIQFTCKLPSAKEPLNYILLEEWYVLARRKQKNMSCHNKKVILRLPSYYSKGQGIYRAYLMAVLWQSTVNIWWMFELTTSLLWKWLNENTSASSHFLWQGMSLKMRSHACR